MIKIEIVAKHISKMIPETVIANIFTKLMGFNSYKYLLCETLSCSG